MRRVYPVLLVLVASCGIFDSFTGGGLLTLRRRQQQWLAQGIRDYDFDFHRSCFCGTPSIQPVRIEVRNSMVSRVINRSTGEVILPEEFTRWPTIDSLFVWTERAIENGYNVDISYDRTYRFPARVEGDIPDAIDDEFVNTAGNLVRVSGRTSLTIP